MKLGISTIYIEHAILFHRNTIDHNEHGPKPVAMSEKF